MVESIEHQQLKVDTATILNKLGYDVNTDVEVSGPRGGKRTVDVIAENATGKYAFEVGTVGATKFDQLSRNYGFNQVIHVPEKNRLQEAIGLIGRGDVVFSGEGEPWEVIEEAGIVKFAPMWPGGETSIERSKKKELQDWQLLRDTFGPVSTGVELYISYSVANGFITTCDCKTFKDKDTCRHTDYINEWNKRLNLDKHVQELADRTLTWGFCLVEKVFEDSDRFKAVQIRPDIKDLGEIIELKVVDVTKKDLEVERKQTYEVLYYALDKGTKEEVKVQTWQAGLATWNVRAPNVLGESIVAPTEKYAQWLLNIQKSYAKGVYRQGNPIPIFIAKNWGKAKSKALRSILRKREESGGIGSLVLTGDVEVKLLGVEGQMLSRTEAFDHYIEMIASSMTVPSFFFNVSSASRSDPIEKQMELFKSRVGKFARIIKRYIEHEYFEPLIEYKFGKNSPVPRLVFNESVQTHDHDILQLRQLLGVRYISPQLREAAERRLADKLGLELPDELEIIVPGSGAEEGKVNRPHFKHAQDVEDIAKEEETDQ